MSRKKHYVEIYNSLNKSLIVAKEKLIKPLLPPEKRLQDLIKEIKEIRRELDKIFSHSILYRICNECHKRSNGGCCKDKRNSYMSWADATYILLENIKFELPYPNIEFLASFNEAPCLFLSPKGCLLKEKRPIVCMQVICDELEIGLLAIAKRRIVSEKQVINLIKSLKRESGLLFKHILSKSRLYLFHNLANPEFIHITKPLK